MNNLSSLFLILLVLLLLGFWIYCFIDILTSKFSGNEKLLWVVVVLFAPVSGMVLYLILGKRNKLEKRKFDPFQK